MLLRKMLRDLKNNAAQFLSIFLMIFLGVFIFSGMTSIGQGMKQSVRIIMMKRTLLTPLFTAAFLQTRITNG